VGYHLVVLDGVFSEADDSEIELHGAQQRVLRDHLHPQVVPSVAKDSSTNRGRFHAHGGLAQSDLLTACM
jgi:hypothetical protein